MVPTKLFGFRADCDDPVDQLVRSVALQAVLLAYLTEAFIVLHLTLLSPTENERSVQLVFGPLGLVLAGSPSDKMIGGCIVSDWMDTKTESYIERAHLVEERDPENDNPIFRRPGFEGVTSLGEMDSRIGEALREAREKQGLTRPHLAPLLGLASQVYGRYERGEAKLHVTRLVHLSELLDCSPLDVLFSAAPHLWGDTQEEAEIRMRLMRHVEKLPMEKARLLLGVVESFLALKPQGNEGS